MIFFNNKGETTGDEHAQDMADAVVNIRATEPDKELDDRLRKWKKAEQSSLKLKTMLFLNHERMVRIQRLRAQENIARRLMRKWLRQDIERPKDKGFGCTKESSSEALRKGTVTHRANWQILRVGDCPQDHIGYCEDSEERETSRNVE